jgi:hypothetical protein
MNAELKHCRLPKFLGSSSALTDCFMSSDLSEQPSRLRSRFSLASLRAVSSGFLEWSSNARVAAKAVVRVTLILSAPLLSPLLSMGPCRYGEVDCGGIP